MFTKEIKMWANN